jgi:DNA-binding MarR family transcriptional regulator
MSIEPYDFGILLGLAYQDFVAELNDHLARRGFTSVGASYGYVFRALVGQDLTTSQLAARLRITPQGAAKIVDEMAATGYVERQVDPGDRRAKVLRLTERGRGAVSAARAFHRDFERRLARRHGTAAAAAVREALTGIVERDATATDAADRLLRPL